MRRNFRILEYFVMIGLILSVFGCVDDLSRSKAGTMIEEAIRPELLGGGSCSVDSKSCSFWDIHVGKEGLSRLEEMGFIKMKESSFSLIGSQNHFDLTDAATPYIIQMEGDEGRISLEIITATISSVEVTGISKPSDMFGQKICTATYTVSYKSTPFGDILVKEKSKLSKSGEAMFILYDDGWRIEGGRPEKSRSKIIPAQEDGAKSSTTWIAIIIVLIVIVMIVVGIFAKTRSGRTGAGKVWESGDDTISESHAFCTQCGEKNDSGASFCMCCGAKMEC